MVATRSLISGDADNNLTFHLREMTSLIIIPVSTVPGVRDLDPLGGALLHMDKQPRQKKIAIF